MNHVIFLKVGENRSITAGLLRKINANKSSYCAVLHRNDEMEAFTMALEESDHTNLTLKLKKMILKQKNWLKGDNDRLTTSNQKYLYRIRYNVHYTKILYLILQNISCLGKASILLQ